MQFNSIVECCDMVTLDATEREGVEPAFDDGQVAGEAMPIHDEAKAADAHVRAVQSHPWLPPVGTTGKR
jgi:hypothetical protein